MTRGLRERHKFFVTEQHKELVAAVRELAQVLDAAESTAVSTAPQTGGNRAQRRTAKRRRQFIFSARMESPHALTARPWVKRAPIPLKVQCRYENADHH